MRTHSLRSIRFAAGLLALLIAVAGVAFAGPPLICHAFDIGSAKSLPWISHDWNLTGTETYDTSKLASDTFAILASNSSVLVHMETLRRATLYARKDPAAAKESPHQAYRGHEICAVRTGRPLSTILTSAISPKPTSNGLSLRTILLKGSTATPSSSKPSSFAAMTPKWSSPPRSSLFPDPLPEHRDHVQKAMAGAKTDALLAQNLSSQFIGERGETVAELLTKPAAARETKP